ncbi:hypothetical protein F5146DRAFT_579668 [Armillaria mellea]|nr:hypothetical protein F5146DRAFT_579668 [Armillaria mellea]
MSLPRRYERRRRSDVSCPKCGPCSHHISGKLERSLTRDVLLLYGVASQFWARMTDVGQLALLTLTAPFQCAIPPLYAHTPPVHHITRTQDRTRPAFKTDIPPRNILEKIRGTMHIDMNERNGAAIMATITITIITTMPLDILPRIIMLYLQTAMTQNIVGGTTT